ncbi:MAG: helix-turn-helix domain-containing protein [Petrotogales bacterium]
MSKIRPKIEAFLKENDDKAFTTKEISEALNENRSTVNRILIDLEDEGLVMRRVYKNLIRNAWIGD